jgi:uncharacterized integral membrane protein (TIGR00697 family)
MKFLIDKETKFLILALTYITFIITAALTASKIVALGFLTFSAGNFAYAFSFAMSDVISEVWGKEKAKKVVTAGLFALFISWVFTFIAIVLPSAPFWTMQEAYTNIFGTSIRIIMGGFVAYIVAQYHDVWMFNFLKKLTKGKYLWLRNNGSTFISQFIDSTIIVVIGFSGVVPINALPLLIFGWWFIKIVIAVIDTPIVYLLVYWARGKETEIKDGITGGTLVHNERGRTLRSL